MSLKREKNEDINVTNEESLEKENSNETELECKSSEDDNESVELLEGVVKELMEQNKKISDENSKLNNEIAALKDRILRLNAEYDNFRKRTAKEKEAIFTDACDEVLKNFLPVLDNLERALVVEGSVEDIKKGIEMTVKQFQDALTKVQVEEIPGEGEFDPNLHNAVMHEENKEFGANQISEVLQKGYIRGDRVLRHSIVKVAN